MDLERSWDWEDFWRRPLVEDLKYSNNCFNKFYESFSVEQSVSILGQIEEFEQNIDKVKDILTKKILS